MNKTTLTLMVFTLMSFVLSMTAFVFSGILDKVAVSLHITVANSGLLNTMYSYGAAFGVPVTLVVFRKIERTRMMKLMLLITILMTVALVLVQSFGQLLVIRLIMGVSGNSYGVLAISTVVALSPRERQGRSMAYLIMGSSLALVIGIPLTRALSSVLDWRSIFWILDIMMLLALIYFKLYLPKADHETTKLDLKNEWTFLKSGEVRGIVLYSLVMFVGYSAFYTYITPYLLLLFPSLEGVMSFILVLFGLASFAGNLIGGHVSDRLGYSRALLLGAGLQLATVVLILAFQPVKWPSVIFILLWIMSAWFTGLQLNTGIAQATHNKSSFMISINSSAIQLGGAVGSSLAAAAIPLYGMKNIIYIILLASVGILLLQLFANKRYKERSVKAVR